MWPTQDPSPNRLALEAMLLTLALRSLLYQGYPNFCEDIYINFSAKAGNLKKNL